MSESCAPVQSPMARAGRGVGVGLGVAAGGGVDVGLGVSVGLTVGVAVGVAMGVAVGVAVDVETGVAVSAATLEAAPIEGEADDAEQPARTADMRMAPAARRHGNIGWAGGRRLAAGS